jgi:hypothetical protein
VSRGDAARRTLATLRFLWSAPQDSAGSGAIGYRGFFYHFLDQASGARYGQVELSTVDTALLLAGALFVQGYFAGTDSTERAIRELADSLYRRTDWRWAAPRPPLVAMGWTPETGFLPSDWVGYNEAMILYLLALGSPTHPLDSLAWDAWTSGYRWGTFYGQSYVQFGPLFGHEYSHVWVDFRGIRDAYMRAHGIDYFENTRRAAYAQQAYAAANPDGWRGYSGVLWGLTACDGPANVTLTLAGRARQFHTYWARGAALDDVNDDGTLAPTAVGGAVPFVPEIALPALQALRRFAGGRLFATYGFLDAFNPTFTAPVPVERGDVDPVFGWVDSDHLGIDQGAMLAMVENYRTELVWRVMRRHPYLVRGLVRAGFAGGWLGAAPRRR